MFQSLREMNTSAKDISAINEKSMEDSVLPYDDHADHGNSETPSQSSQHCKQTFVVSSTPSHQDRPEQPSRRAQWLGIPHRFGTLIEANNEDGRPWKTTFIRFGPLSGIFTMIVAISSIIASLGILLGSEGKDIRNWKAPPSTYLAVLTAVCNLSVRYACIQGVVIAWWYRASRGTELTKLHHDWRSGTTVRGALTSGKHMGILGVACIMSTLVVIDGPLLQRASIIKTINYSDHPVHLDVAIATELPTRWDRTGSWTTKADMGLTTFWSYAFNHTVPTGGGSTTPNTIYITATGDGEQIDSDFSAAARSDASISAIDGCPGDCKAKIRAPALAPAVCTTKEYPVDYAKTYMRDVSEVGSRAPPLEAQTFMVSVGLMVEQSEESLYLVTGYFDGEGCTGTLHQTTCTLRSAVGEYDASIRDGVITLDDAANPRIVAVANNTPVDNSIIPGTASHTSTIAPIALQAWLRWETVSAMSYSPRTGYTPIILGPTADAYKKVSDSHCVSFRDPHKDVLADLNKMMVWVGVLSAAQEGDDLTRLESNLDAGASLNSSVTGELAGTHSVYSIAFAYFGAAAAVVLCCIATIAPTYWGWWTLGRPVSFSPLELAKAFESPLLERNDSNSSGRDIAKIVESTPIRYGARRDHSSNGRTRLAFADPGGITTPELGARFAC